jgi:hypothetical protein
LIFPAATVKVPPLRFIRPLEKKDGLSYDKLNLFGGEK